MLKRSWIRNLQQTLKLQSRYRVRRRRSRQTIEALECRALLSGGPVLNSINLVGATPTNASIVSFTATFSEPVTGVDPTDFSLVETGTIGATLTQVTPVSQSVYTVTVSGITGSGTLGLNFINDGSIHDLIGNGLTSQNASFADQTTLDTENGPRSVTMGDVNGDGKLDLAVTNEWSNSVGVFLGNGDGTFGTQLTFATGDIPMALALGDVDGDGKPDLVVTNYGGDTVSVLLGNGDGTFETQQTYATWSSPMSVAIGDVNGDGKPDLAVANSGGTFENPNDEGGNTVSVLLGNGNGTFQTQQTFATGLKPHILALGDVNADGGLDLAVTNWGSNTVSVFLGNGNGTFGTPQTYDTESDPHELLLGDLNADGKLDLAVANSHGNSVSVFLGNGNGTFGGQQTFATLSGPNSLLLGDVNSDFKPDLVTANWESSTVNVLLGNGNGTFGTQQTFATGSNPFSVALGDVNSDGKPDLAVANWNSNTLGVLLNTVNSNFTSPVYTIDRICPLVQSINRTTPAIANTNASSVTYTVTFSEPVTGVDPTDFSLVKTGTIGATLMQVVPVSSTVYTVTVSGITGNGTLGLNLVDNDSIKNSSDLPLGDPGLNNGNFSGPITTLDHASPWVQSIDRAIPADANTNASTVTFTATFSEPVTGVDPTDFSLVQTGSVGVTLTQISVVSPSVYRLTASGVTGNGTLGLNLVDNGSIHDLVGNQLTTQNAIASFANQTTFATGSGPWSVATGDMNGDGNPDLVVVNQLSNTVSLRLGNGDGTFQSQQTIATGSGPFSVAFGDVNGDGHSDLAVANSRGSTVSVFLGNGNGAFAAHSTFSTGTSPFSVTMGDVNGDGSPDLITANAFNSTVSVLLGNGNGTFQAKRNFSTGSIPFSVTIGDLNSDGKPDLITPNGNDNTISVLMGNGDGTFQLQQSVAVGAFPKSVTVGDLNGDGKPDLATANWDDDSVSVLLGNGDGSFQSQQTFAAGTNPYSVTLGDVNGDGKPDLAVANFGSNTVSVLLGDGIGAFQPQQTFAAGSSPVSVTLGDVNHDSKPDLAVTNSGDDMLSLFLATSNGNFTGQVYSIDHISPFVVSINRTSPTSDYAPTAPSSVTFTVTFSEPVTGVEFFNFRPATTRTIRADVDPWDVTALNDREYTVTVSHIVGIGTLGLSLVDGDTIRDLNGNRLTTPGNGVEFEYGAFGPYAFGHPPEYGTPLELEPVGDVNRDGYPDKIIPFYGRRDEGNNVDEGADLQLGNSDGTFGEGVEIYRRGRGARTSVALGDVNRDGKLDVIVGIWDGSYSDGAVLLGNGDGTFKRIEDDHRPWDFLIQDKPESGYFLWGRPSLSLEDVNGDSNLDLVVVISNALSVLLGNGNGTFQPQQWIDLSPLQSDSVQLGDFNEDGRPDFFIASDVDQKWGALLNTTNGDFTGQVYTFETAPVVTDDPDDQEGYYYDNFSFEASASEAPDAQWQLSTDNGASWVNIIADNVDSWIETTTDYRSGVTTTILTFGPYLANMNVGSLYRVVFSNEVNTATTGPASFKIYTPPVVTWQPSPTTVRAGEIAEFTANADGFPTPTVKWQVSNDSGVNWNDIAGETSTTYRFMTKSTDNGNQYRAMFSNLAESDVPTYAATLSVPPVVTSINLVGPPTMNATSLIFTATFSEPVTGVDPTDFSLVKTGTVGTTLLQVTPVSTLVYNVTVSGITGNGTLGINLIDNDSIKDLFLIPLNGAGAENGNFTGPIVTLDHISPFVQSINRTTPASATTNANNVSFTATFSEPVTGVDPTDFSLVMTGTIGATLTQVTPVSASVYSVTVSGITGNGTLGLNLVDNGSIHDFVGNSLTSLNVPSFVTQASIPTGSSPRSLVLGDVDADGKSDLVVANSGDNSVSLLLGNGNGTFQAQQTFAAGTAPVSIVVGDLNNDGNPDLAVANLGSNTVSVLLGHGNGAFEAQQTFATESMPYSIAMGDLNADGKPDLAVVNRGSDSVSVLLGNGNGTFQPQIRFATESAPSSIELADLNGDGKVDLVIANHDSDTVSVLLGNGNGTFQSQQTFATGSEPYSVVVGDLNGDGNPDLAIANRNSGTVSVLTGNGDGTFQSQQTFASAPGAISMAIGDLNGDGKLDLAIENGTFVILKHPTTTLWVLVGKGDGTFTAPQVLRTGILGYAVTLGDVNNDGKSDLVAANSNVGSASVLLNAISGDFTGQTYTLDHTSPWVQSINRSIPASTATNATTLTFTATFSEPVTGVDPTDFSLVMTGTIGATSTQVTQVNSSVYTVTISGITGEGTLGLNLIDDGSISDLAGNRLTSGTDASFAHQATFRTETDQFSVTMGDFNDDNKLDLAVAGGGGGLDSVSVLLGSGNGTFQTYQSFPTGSLPSWVTTGDVNGDGKLDLVVANQDSANVSILLGNGNGTFQPQQTFATGTGPISVVLGDVNGDGTPDLVVANVRSNTLSVLLGNGNGTFQPEQTFATGSGPNSVTMGDVNGDGKLDLAVANSHNFLVSVLLGNGNGTFQLRQDFPTPNRATGVAMGDVNGDGRADLIVTLAISSVGVSLGNGDGSFQSLQVFETGTAVYSPILGDVNGDGKPDIVVANESDDTVSVLLGNEDGTFLSQQTFATGDAPISVTMGDVNGDGKPDLAVASFGSRYVSVLLGNTNGNFTGEVYTLDHTSPWIQSINRTNPENATTNASSVSFTATFSEPVTGVDPTDFSLVKTGTIGATLTQIAVVSPSVYTVTISGITGDGTLGLNLVDNGSIHDLAGNGLSSQNVASFANQVTFAAGAGPHTVTLGDLNRDGNSDLVVTNIGSNTVSVMLGNGNGTFKAQQTFATGSGPFSVSIGDVNGDGNPDLAVENQASNTVSVLLGNGDGTFQTQQTFATQGSPTTLTLGDVNKDSKLDIVVANQGSGTVSILLGNGNGTFKPQQTFSAGGGLPNTVALGDINGDGNPDLAVSNWSGFVSLLMGNGDGTFQPQKKLLGAGNLDSVTMGDVNGDGNLDIAVANRTGNSIIAFLGNGNGTFKPQQSFATGSFPRSVMLGDVNRDGMHDLVVTNENSNTVSVLLGNGNGTFQTQQTFITGSRPFSVTLGDMNGDGRTDLAVANWTGNSVSVLLNTTSNFIGQVYTLDHTSPSVQSINRTTPATMTTSATSVVFTATFNEPVTGVDLTDFLLVRTGTVGVTLLQVSQISPSTYTVTVGGITGDGSLGLNLVDDGSIRDLVGNVLTVQGAGGKFTGQAYTMLHVAPSVTTQPVSTSVDAGATAMFSAAASGSPIPTIQWQVSLNGGSVWTNISGATSASLSVVAAAGDNGKKYRAVFSNVAGTAITDVATLTVSSSPAANVSSIGVRWGTSGSAMLVNASGGRLLPAGRTNDVAWFNINRLTITLDRPLSTLDAASVSVVGIVGGSYGPVTVSGSGTTWTITLAKAITNADKVTVVIGNSHLVTYQRRLDVLPGDFNDDGVVATGEVTLINNATIRPYNIWADLNGDGVVDINDVRLARRKVGTRLPT